MESSNTFSEKGASLFATSITVSIWRRNFQLDARLRHHFTVWVTITGFGVFATLGASLLGFIKIKLPREEMAYYFEIFTRYHQDTTFVAHFEKYQRENSCCGIYGPDDWLMVQLRTVMGGSGGGGGGFQSLDYGFRQNPSTGKCHLTPPTIPMGCGKKLREEIHIFLSTIAGFIFVETVVLAGCGIFGWKCFFYWLERDVIMIPQDQISNIIVIEPESSSSSRSSGASYTSRGQSGNSGFTTSGYLNSRSLINSMHHGSSRHPYNARSSGSSRRTRHSSFYESGHSGERYHHHSVYHAALPGTSAGNKSIDLNLQGHKSKKSKEKSHKSKSNETAKESTYSHKSGSKRSIGSAISKFIRKKDSNKSKDATSKKINGDNVSENNKKSDGPLMVVKKKNNSKQKDVVLPNKGHEPTIMIPPGAKFGSNLTHGMQRGDNKSSRVSSFDWEAASKVMGSYYPGAKESQRHHGNKSHGHHYNPALPTGPGHKVIGEMKLHKEQSNGHHRTKGQHGTVAVVRNKNPPPIRNIFAVNEENRRPLAKNIKDMSGRKDRDRSETSTAHVFESLVDARKSNHHYEDRHNVDHGRNHHDNQHASRSKSHNKHHGGVVIPNARKPEEPMPAFLGAMVHGLDGPPPKPKPQLPTIHGHHNNNNHSHPVRTEVLFKNRNAMDYSD